MEPLHSDAACPTPLGHLSGPAAVLDIGDVLKRIVGDHNQVGELAHLQCAQFGADAAHLSSMACGPDAASATRKARRSGHVPPGDTGPAGRDHEIDVVINDALISAARRSAPALIAHDLSARDPVPGITRSASESPQWSPDASRCVGDCQDRDVPSASVLQPLESRSPWGQFSSASGRMGFGQWRPSVRRRCHWP